jgi:hypothetical protein
MSTRKTLLAAMIIVMAVVAVGEPLGFAVPMRPRSELAIGVSERQLDFHQFAIAECGR